MKVDLRGITPHRLSGVDLSGLGVNLDDFDQWQSAIRRSHHIIHEALTS